MADLSRHGCGGHRHVCHAGALEIFCLRGQRLPEPSVVQAVGRAASVTALPPERATGGYAENMPAREPAATAPRSAVHTPWREPGKVHAGSGAQALPARSRRSPPSRVVTYSRTTDGRVKLPGCCPCSIRLRQRSLLTASSSSPESLGI